MFNSKELFLIFFIYSVLGYFIEVTAVSLGNKKLTLSRGFLIGPYIPVFGVGGLIITLTLSAYQKDILILFGMSLVLCSVVEYFTSYIMEKLFKLRWWDYSDIKYNLNGRICLSNATYFGVGGVLIIKYINPLLKSIFNNIPSNIFNIIIFLTSTIILIDFIVSTIAVTKLKINTEKYFKKDATSAIKKEIKKNLEESSFIIKRLIKSFPSLDKLNPKFINIKNIIFKEENNLSKLVQKILNK